MQTRLRITSMHVFLTVLVAGALLHGELARAARASARVQTALTVFAGVFVQAVPFLVLGVLVSGAVATLVSPAMLGRALPRGRYASVGVAGVAGAALPGCECGAVPVARRLIDRGAPDASALAFLLSAPAINPVVVVSTAVAFPGEPGMVVARLFASLLTALIVGAVWTRIGRPEWMTAFTRPRLAQSPLRTEPRWVVFTESARHDFLQAGSFLVIGAAVAAALHVLVPAAVYEHLAGQMLLAIAVMAALAVVLALCSEADAFVASSMSMLPLLPRLVFLVVGPAVDVKLVAMQAGSFGRPFALRFAPLTFGVAVVTATVIGALVVGVR